MAANKLLSHIHPNLRRPIFDILICAQTIIREYKPRTFQRKIEISLLDRQINIFIQKLLNKEQHEEVIKTFLSVLTFIQIIVNLDHKLNLLQHKYVKARKKSRLFALLENTIIKIGQIYKDKTKYNTYTAINVTKNLLHYLTLSNTEKNLYLKHLDKLSFLYQNRMYLNKS